MRLAGTLLNGKTAAKQQEFAQDWLALAMASEQTQEEPIEFSAGEASLRQMTAKLQQADLRFRHPQAFLPFWCRLQRNRPALVDRTQGFQMR